MELALNLAWILLSLTTVLWFTMNRRNWSGSDRARAVIALGLVVMILLPAISMTDDLLATRFPAEIEQMQSLHKKAVLAIAVLETPSNTLVFLVANSAAQSTVGLSLPLHEVTIPAPLDALRGYRTTHGTRPPINL